MGNEKKFEVGIKIAFLRYQFSHLSEGNSEEGFLETFGAQVRENLEQRGFNSCEAFLCEKAGKVWNNCSK